MDCRSFFNLFKVFHPFAFPCDDVVPSSFNYSCSFPAFVEVVGNHGEISDLASVVLVGAYGSDASLEFDFVDVFNLFHKKCV